MKIIVLIKQVPDIEKNIKITAISLFSYHNYYQKIYYVREQCYQQAIHICKK